MFTFLAHLVHLVVCRLLQIDGDECNNYCIIVGVVIDTDKYFRKTTRNMWIHRAPPAFIFMPTVCAFVKSNLPECYMLKPVCFVKSYSLCSV